MENYFIEKDIPVIYVKATSFPGGVGEAHQKLHAMFPPASGNQYYGISYPDKGDSIIYLAAVSLKKPTDISDHNLGKFVIRKGNYTSEVIHDFMKHIPSIGQTFGKLLQHPRLDPQGYCVEEYLNENDVRCLVKLLDD